MGNGREWEREQQADRGASLKAQLGKNLPSMQETQLNSCVGKICWRRDRLPAPVFLGFPCGSAGKESAFNSGDLGLIPGLGRSPRGGSGYPLQYSGLENSMDCIVHGGHKSQTWLSHFYFQTWGGLLGNQWGHSQLKTKQNNVRAESSVLGRTSCRL